RRLGAPLSGGAVSTLTSTHPSSRLASGMAPEGRGAVRTLRHWAIKCCGVTSLGAAVYLLYSLVMPGDRLVRVLYLQSNSEIGGSDVCLLRIVENLDLS